MTKRKQTMITEEACIADAVENAYSEISELLEEAREVVDGASGTNRENTSRIVTLTETVDSLERHSEAPEVPDGVTEMRVTWQAYKMKKRGLSRSQRLSNACSALTAVAEHLQDQGEVEGADELRDELENAVGEIEGVEFPGWAG